MILFSDGFESGNLAQWTNVTNLVVQQVDTGSYAARGTATAGGAAYARKSTRGETDAALAWFTDFVGYMPMPEGGGRETHLTADYNAEMIEHILKIRKATANATKQ